MAYRRKRYGYGNRRTRRKYRRRFRRKMRRALTQTQKALRVYHNPLSKATLDPRIPDGMNQLSRGYKFQEVREFAPADGTSEMEFIILPGLTCSMLFRQKIGTEMKFVDFITFPQFYGLECETNADNPPTNALTTKYKGVKQFDWWRVVSQSAQFALINNADENDGWWEAVRVPLSQDIYPSVWAKWTATAAEGELYRFSATTTAPAGASANAETPCAVFPKFGQFSHICDHASYVTGKLRDIHRYRFDLRPVRNEHLNTKTDEFVLNNDSAVLSGLGTKAVDYSYDAIVIKIHGRETSSGGVSTKLVGHCVSNFEVVHKESLNSVGHNAMSRSPFLPASAFSREIRKKQVRIGAATKKASLTI